MSEWMPIDTAPMDESSLILWCDGVTIGSWLANPKPWNAGNWWIEGGQITGTPTHWMPLPEAPK